MYETIMRTLLGAFTGVLCAILPMFLGYLLDKMGGGVLGALACVICGGIFGFLNKSLVLTVIVMIIVLLFLALDKSKPSGKHHTENNDNSVSNNSSEQDVEHPGPSSQNDTDTQNTEGKN